MRAIVLILAAALCYGTVDAQVPHKINYQGYLTNPGGTPVDATVAMTFMLYNVSAGGSPLYTEIQAVTVTNGEFNALIGAVTPLPLPFDVPYYLGVIVGADPEMTPRQPVAASAYSIRAASAETLTSAAIVTGSQITGTIATATLPAGNLTGTIGTTQIANNAVTQAKLSPLSGGTAGNVLGTDGSNLQWQAATTGTVTGVGTGSGLTGGPITTSGTINLATTQMLPTVACTTNQIPKWNGSAWACAADNAANKFINVNIFGAFLVGGTFFNAGFGANAGMRLPDSSAPQFSLGFTIPPDYTPGTDMTVRFLWHTPATGCGIELDPNYISVARAGRTHILGASATDGLTMVGGTVLNAPATANQTSAKDMTINSPSAATNLQPGDSVIFGLFRPSGAGTDTCANYLAIHGVSVSYQ